MPIKTLFLDAGGVLVYPNWSRINETLARHGVPVEAAALAAAEPYAKLKLDTGEAVNTTRDHDRGWLYFDLILQQANVMPSEQTRAAFAELHEYHQRQNLWEYVPDDVPTTLDRLRGLGLALVVVSNANGTLKAMLDRLDLARRVDYVFDSFEEGIEKPDPRFFQIALDRAGARRDSTVHVGDMYHVDVVGARAAGLRGVLLDPLGLHRDRDCARVASLGGLVDHLLAGTLA